MYLFDKLPFAKTAKYISYFAIFCQKMRLADSEMFLEYAEPIAPGMRVNFVMVLNYNEVFARCANVKYCQWQNEAKRA